MIDLDARLIERWRTGEDRPEIVETSLAWKPEGAAQPFVLDVEQFFAEVMNEQG